MLKILQFPFQQFFVKKNGKRKKKKNLSRPRFMKKQKGNQAYLLPTHILGPNPKGK